MKKRLRAFIFVFVMAGVIFLLNQITLNRRSEGCIQLSDFYGLEKNRTDVLFIGSSHVYYGVNTCLLYDDYGIASYLLASPGQPVWLSYYLLEEALKTQSPELVVVDTGTLFRTEEDFGMNSWETLISMKPSQTKWKAIQAMNWYEEEMDAVGAFFAFPYYHTRVVTLDSEDFNNTERIRYHGYKPEFTTISESELTQWESTWEKIVQSRTDEDTKEDAQTQVLTERTEYYLRRLIELCQDREIALLLVNSPFVNLVEEKKQAGDQIQMIADAYGVPMIEGNYYKEEMQIHFEEDLLDASHLNYYGSVKYTKYLAEWMQEHCSLPDRRGDKDYWAWEEMSDLFWHLEMKKRKLQEIDEPQEYAQVLEEEQVGSGFTICWEQQGDAEVYQDGKCIFAASAGEDYLEHMKLGSSDLAVSCTDGNTTVCLDQKEYSFVENGVNVLVYDKVAKQVVDGVGFDRDQQLQAVR